MVWGKNIEKAMVQEGGGKREISGWVGMNKEASCMRYRSCLTVEAGN